MENTSGIYLITNCQNGKQYVGQSYDIERRIRTHKNKLRTRTHGNTHLQSAWNKYGEQSFSFSVLEYCPTDDLNGREMYWIDKLGTLSPRGYNLTLGGEGNRGYHLSDETKKLIGDKVRCSPARYWKGKHLSDTHKEKLREAAKNRSEETKRKMGEASKRTMSNPEIKQRMISHQKCRAVFCHELGEIFSSMGEAGRKTGVSPGNISKVCNGIIRKSGGYHWSFVDAL
jgi:group I intron endonuclease